ncbi:MAG: nitrate- and nitrite sensing domain-containing protein [Streptosporangiaceae bacterium]
MLSQARKTLSIPEPNDADPAAAAAATGGGAIAPAGPGPDGPFPVGDSQPPEARPAARPASRRALKNWKVRSRLFLLVVIPTITAVAAGGIFIASSVGSAVVDQRVLTLANLSGKTTGLVQALQVEREDTVRYIVLGNSNGGRGASAKAAIPPGPELGLLQHDYATTTGWASQVKTLASGIDGSYSVLAQQDAQAAVTAIDNLPAIRAAATGTQLPALNVINEYATAIDALLAVESQIAVGSSDSTLAGSVRVLGLVSGMKEQASQQQALLTSALRSDLITLGQFGPAQQAAITDAQAQQQGDENEFGTAATGAQRQLFNSVLSTSNVAQAEAQEQQAISLASSQSPIATDPTIPLASSSLWYVVNGMRSVEQQFSNSVISRSESLHSGAITSAVIFSLAVALLLGIALAATILVGRSMVGPLRRLRNGAFEVAGTRLPEMVRRMSETDGGGIPPEVQPIDVDSTDEIGEVARAFDQVHQEAVRLAANEASLRSNVNAMFVNLSRRSQVLVERQIRLITRLEQGEEDSKRLASLFQMDHLATRMRRNSENLLVLAGQELSRRWSRPVALVDVLRAAASEIEQYERVTLNVQPGISVGRETVSDLVHLTAELVENATSFSAADTPVTLAAYLQGNGWTLIEVADQGVGMTAQQIADANWRLANPPVMDVAVSRRMGLFVVARLAGRRGIRVRLCPVPSGGLIAQVWLPAEVVTREADSGGPLRSVPAAANQPAVNQAVANQSAASIAEELRADLAENGHGHGMPQRRSTRETGVGQSGFAPTGRLVSSPEAGQNPSPAQGAEAGEGAPSLPRLRARLRAARIATGPGPQDAGPGQGGSASYNGAQPTAAQYRPAQPGAAGPGAGTGQHRRMDAGALSTPGSEVIIPPADSVADRQRLPIFEAVESDWFRSGGQVVGSAPARSSGGWSSPAADAGWRAAEVAHAPTSDGITQTGLPKRVPKANLVPGSVAAPGGGGPGAEASPLPAPARSAEEARDRFSNFQRGIRRARAAAIGNDPHSGEGTTS